MSNYFLDGGLGPVSEFERDHWQSKRNILPILAAQQFISQAGKDGYAIHDRLFEAYGLEPPAR
ncbi:MAG: hypothetical protein M3464_03045 [Chloroflexota bacterium]|nr:hypothetical protein [Chloroflexota bacterium]